MEWIIIKWLIIALIGFAITFILMVCYFTNKLEKAYTRKIYDK